MRAVVIGRVNELHAHLVIGYLAKAQVPTQTFELGLGYQKYDVSGSAANPCISTSMATISREALSEALVINLDFAVNQPDPVLTNDLFAAREWRRLLMSTLEMFYRDGVGRWLMRPDAQVLQDKKLILLNVAERLGGVVPETVLTTALENSIEPGQWVAKALSAWQEVRPGRYFNTRLVTEDILVRLSEGTLSGPLFLQRYIKHTTEYRVYFIYGTIVTVEKNVPSAVDDFRIVQRDRAAAQVVSTNPTTRQLVTRICGELQINYGAFDFALDEVGTLWLLDVNPAGSWAYLDNQYNLGLTEIIMKRIISENV